MQNLLTPMPDVKSSATRRGVLTGLLASTMTGTLPSPASAATDELAFLIDSYREVHAYRIGLAEQINGLEADEPSTVIDEAEIKPSIGRCSGAGYFTYRQAERFFSRMQTSDHINDMTRERYARAWEFAQALFSERQAEYQRWDAETGYSVLCTQEENVFDREAALLHSIVSRPCAGFAEARMIAEFVMSDIPDDTFHTQHAIALRSIAGIAA